MSGGHFDYGSGVVSEFARKLKTEIDENGSYDGYGFEPQTIAVLKYCHKVIKLAGVLSHHVEWLYSGDHGEESFRNLIKEAIWEAKCKITSN